MAIEKADKVTGDLFDTIEKEMLRKTIETHLATLRRRVNSESHGEIKDILQRDVHEYVKLANKVQGLLP
ncbi:putative transcription regulation protein [Microvirus AZ-2020]|nr:putative transcription regulation protein [Microvirus AZ-2020]